MPDKVCLIPNSQLLSTTYFFYLSHEAEKSLLCVCVCVCLDHRPHLSPNLAKSNPSCSPRGEADFDPNAFQKLS